MIKRITFFSVVFLLLGSTAHSQAQSEAQSLHPVVQKYVDMLDLSDEQTEALQAVYEETAARSKEIDDEMTAARMSVRDNIQKATPSEKERHRNEMNELSKQRIELKAKRAEKLEEIITPEQKEILENQ
jgi:Spy/CpxP family protein refolding chaperone